MKALWNGKTESRNVEEEGRSSELIIWKKVDDKLATLYHLFAVSQKYLRSLLTGTKVTNTSEN
jgi:hypothetical protein